ncbi:MAG: hypothetical protein CME70_06165 [Halobacteriovorax sp.]|nr:hypothetical protein [Halobacteriovorax sp.]|tara:strand:- start:13325 stop:14662 length:1338 start_codon:yes stop_codon:yes gene_type:complete
MTIKTSKTSTDSVSVPTGYEGNNIPEDMVLPSCTVEDVDRAIFNLFNKELPLIFNQGKEAKRIPVIFATGERFAVLRRKRPLRDKSGALILPLVSIMRTGIAQDIDRGIGPGQSSPMIIRKRLEKSDPAYQALINRLGLKNQDNISHDLHKIDGKGDGTEPGTVATRRNSAPRTTGSRSGQLLELELSDNIFEIVTMPPVKFYSATYQVTFWAQYTQQMNDMMMAVLSSYMDNHRRTFRIETDKGYWFIAYVASELSPGNNYEDFTDDERLVRYSFEISVPAYVLASDHPGAGIPLRKFVSAPIISFEHSDLGNSSIYTDQRGSLPSGDPDSYILQDFATIHGPVPGDSIGSSGIASSYNAAGHPQIGSSVATSDSRAINNNSPDGYAVPGSSSTTVGGHTANPGGITIFKISKDPFTGKEVKTLVKVKTKNRRKGETVLRSFKS